MAKSNSKGKKSNNNKNGSNRKKSPLRKNGATTKPVKAVPSSSSFGVLSFITTLLSFSLGVLTPPGLHYWHMIQTNNDNLSTTTTFASNDDSFSRSMEESSFPPHSCAMEDNAAEYEGILGKDPVPGMHTICMQTTDDTLHIFKNSVPQHHLGRTLPTYIANFAVTSSLNEWKVQFYRTLEAGFELSQRPNQAQPWAVFTTDGIRVADQDSLRGENLPLPHLQRLLQQGSTLVVMEGGQWIWPGIEIGYKRDIVLEGERNATLQTLSLNPLVVSVHGFLSDEECTLVQTTAEPHMKYSQVTLMDKDKGRPASDFRTSQTMFLNPGLYDGQGLLDGIDQRTSQLVRIPPLHQEFVQVLRYGHGERYKAHLDYFDPRSYQQDLNTLRTTEHGLKNRLATVFWYLTTVPEGGETVFPRAGKAPHPYDTGDCSIGLKVKPERGKVIIFYSMLPDGTLDEYSLHGACPVEEGVKWAANKWVWNKPQSYYARYFQQKQKQQQQKRI